MLSVMKSGFDTARFVTQILKRHECPICLLAMRDPVQTECGHLFCRGCLETALTGDHRVCPVDNNEICKSNVCLPALLIVLSKCRNYMYRAGVQCILNYKSSRSIRRFFMTLHVRGRFYCWMFTAIKWTMAVHGLDR